MNRISKSILDDNSERLISFRSSKIGNTLKPCRDGFDCLIQYTSVTEHNTKYSHPCRWSELCRDMYRDLEHAHQYTHEPHQVELCKYGNKGCTKLTDPEHRRKFRHKGLPDFLIPCRYDDACDNRSTEHFIKYKHSKNPFQQINVRQSNSRHTDTTSSFIVQQPCLYGTESYNQSKPDHVGRFSHLKTRTLFENPSVRDDTSKHRLCDVGDDMQRAYRIGATLAFEKLSHSNQNTIRTLPNDAIVVVPGSYDHTNRVLDSLNLKYVTVTQNEILTYPFRNDQTVYINCASNFPIDAAKRLRKEVENGLHIITTDWALTNVLGVAFSDYVRHNGQSTRDEVVSIEVADPNHPLVNGFLPASKHARPQWWLESGSHAIEIVNKHNVRVLIRSEELGQKYGSDAVLVTFDCKQGNVIHMISHFYLQRTETRDARHKMSAKQFAVDIRSSPAATELVSTKGQDLNYAQIQSSSTSAQFIYNQISNRLSSKN